jgi:hypothetical protein
MPVVIGAPVDLAVRMMTRAEVAFTTRGQGGFVIATDPEPGDETAGRGEPAVLVLGRSDRVASIRAFWGP